MADDSRTSQPEASVHVNHWCQHPGCKEWGGWGFERDKTKTDWFCYEHRPAMYRGLPVRGVMQEK